MSLSDKLKKTLYKIKSKLSAYKNYKKYKKLQREKYKRELSQEEIRYVIEKVFESTLGYKPNLDEPKSFNEKLQWYKMHCKDPLMTKCADKYLVRDYIKEKIGEEYLVPLLGVYDSPDEIDFDKLPEKFVLKVNWGSGQNIIVKDKSKLDIEETKARLKEWMKPESNHYYMGFEWCYKNIQPKIIIEEFLVQLDGDLFDYKYLCYNGKVKNLFAVSDRFNNKYIDFYDLEWQRLPFKRLYNTSPNGIPKPKLFDKMLELAEILAKDFIFCRVDFYEVEDKLYFGEITFYPGNGMEPFEPIEWDYKLGEMLELPKSDLSKSE